MATLDDVMAKLIGVETAVVAIISMLEGDGAVVRDKVVQLPTDPVGQREIEKDIHSTASVG